VCLKRVEAGFGLDVAAVVLELVLGLAGDSYIGRVYFACRPGQFAAEVEDVSGLGTAGIGLDSATVADIELDFELDFEIAGIAIAEVTVSGTTAAAAASAVD